MQRSTEGGGLTASEVRVGETLRTVVALLRKIAETAGVMEKEVHAFFAGGHSFQLLSSAQKRQKTTQAPRGVEPRSRDSESHVLTITPWRHLEGGGARGTAM